MGKKVSISFLVLRWLSVVGVLGFLAANENFQFVPNKDNY